MTEKTSKVWEKLGKGNNKETERSQDSDRFEMDAQKHVSKYEFNEQTNQADSNQKRARGKKIFESRARDRKRSKV